MTVVPLDAHRNDRIGGSERRTYTRAPGLFEPSVLDGLARNDRLRVDSADKCWPWRGGVTTKGYGMLCGKLVHRLVYELAVGPIPNGLQLDHLCRNRLCANPTHLEPVTNRENYWRGRRARESEDA